MVALRIELSATRVSDGFGHQPATTVFVSSHFQSRVPRSRTEILLFPKQACFQLHLYPINKVDELGVEPSSSDCKSKRRPVGKPIKKSSSCGIRTRPIWLEKPATSPEVQRARLCLLFLFRFCNRETSAQLSLVSFFRFIASGLGGARTLVCGSSNHCYTVSATSPFFCFARIRRLNQDTKKPGTTRGDTGFNV